VTDHHGFPQNQSSISAENPHSPYCDANLNFSGKTSPIHFINLRVKRFFCAFIAI
jgi:hypothetical protein